MRFLLPVFIIWLMLSCALESTDSTTKKFFDVPSFIIGLEQNMTSADYQVTKSFSLNGSSETKILTTADSLFWQNELITVKNIDLNGPLLLSKLSYQYELDDPASNLLINSYTTDSTQKEGLKRLDIYYLNDPDDIRKIELETISDNPIAESELKITLWINRYGDKLLADSIATVGTNKTMLQSKRAYSSLTKVLFK